MRSSKSLLLAGMIAALMVALMGLSCSDDDTPTTNIIPEEEDNGIESLLGVVSSRVNEHLDSVIGTMEAGLRVATFIDVGTGDIGGALMGSVIPDSTNGDNDWIVSWATDLQAGLGTLTIVDSLTYVVNGAFSVNAKDADAMYIKHNYDYLSSDSTVSFNNVDHRGFLHITGIDGTTATVNGVFNTVINDKFVSADSTVWNDWTIETSITNLTVAKDGSSWTTGCPGSGTATVDVEYRYARDLDIPSTTVWHMTVTFTDGDIDVDVTIGNLSASYEYALCTP